MFYLPVAIEFIWIFESRKQARHNIYVLRISLVLGKVVSDFFFSVSCSYCSLPGVCFEGLPTPSFVRFARNDQLFPYVFELLAFPESLHLIIVSRAGQNPLFNVKGFVVSLFRLSVVSDAFALVILVRLWALRKILRGCVSR